MKKILLAAAVWPGLALADAVHHSRNGREAVIKFDEPVVPLSVVQNGANAELSAEDRGLNLFDISGDAQFIPDARWVDQDRLLITYKKGFNGSTRYRLAFRPGSGKYLSGREMPQTAFEFSYQGQELSQMRTNVGLPNAAACVYVNNPITRAQLDFSAQSEVTYTFREVLRRGPEQQYGRTLRGVPTPAQVKHINPYQVLSLAFPGRDLKDISSEELAAMTPETPIAGYVLVQAEGELSGEGDWELVVTPGSGDLKPSTCYVERPVVPAMQVTAMVQEVKDAAPGVAIEVSLNAPVLTEQMPEIFRGLELKVGEATAVNSEDGRSKTVTLPDGKTLTFTYADVEPSTVSPVVPHNGVSDFLVRTVDFQPPYGETFRILVSGDASLPQVVELTMKAGTQVMLGAASRQDQCCRLSLTPACPSLDCGGTPETPMLLPLNGDRRMKLTLFNQSVVRVSAARLSAEQFLKYARMLNETRLGMEAQRVLAEYRLKLLETRRRLGAGNVSEQEIRSEERALRRLAAPDFARLRSYMNDVAFSSEQELSFNAEGMNGLSSAEAFVDLNSLMGGEAKPGCYIISVRRTVTPAVKAQLERVGANCALFDVEQWYIVQLTDLQLTAGAEAIVLTRLSDGSPVLEGSMLQAGREPLALQNAVASVPVRTGSRPNNTRWLVLQSGEDYGTYLWRDNHPRLDTDSRIEVVRDRGTYRPGETVHLRGILRRVSAQGEASLGNVRRVSVSVNRPNGTRMLDRRVAVNAFGAFEMDFDLPAGEEDVTGDYRVLVESGDYRAYLFVPCQVFRRDSFDVKMEVSMERVRPREYTVKVSATDMNGMPLSRANVHLDIVLQLAGDASRGTAQVKFDAQSYELTLGEDGTATYTGKLPELTAGEIHNVVRVSGEVMNDRHEVRRLNEEMKPYYPADFLAELREHDVLVLNSTTSPTPRVLDREQAVHLRLISYLPRQSKLPNGIIIRDSVRLPLWEGDITVPAGAVNGVPTGMFERWRTFAESLTLSERHTNPPMIVELTAVDAAGNPLSMQLNTYAPRVDEDWMPGYRRVNRSATATLEDDKLRVQAAFMRAGQAVVVIRSVRGTRVLPVTEVKEGMNELVLPLESGEFGSVQAVLMQMLQKDGLYTRLDSRIASANVANRQAALTVDITTPQQNLRPGEKVTLSGTVKGPDGQPANAQVTLFAVDAGMLSVDNHTVPNLLLRFSHVWVSPFAPRTHSLIYEPNARPSMNILPGIWGMYRNSSRTGVRALGARPMVMRNSRAVAPEGTLSAPRAYSAPEAAEPMTMDGAPAPVVGLKGPENGAMAEDEAVAEDCVAECTAAAGAAAAPRLRTNFIPVAVWAPELATDGEGRFSVELTLPDTFTTYKVFALALGADGKTFGNGEAEFTVNQPVMLTPGTPLFMSLGDHLRLPLTISNSTDAEGTWTVTLEGADAPQQVTVQAKSTATLYFDYKATEEGMRTLRWQAVSGAGGDAVEGSFNVRFPAPLLKEAHHLVLATGQEPLRVAGLLAPELAGSGRGSMEILLSSNPLLHLYGCMELVQNTTYPCTHYGATSMMVWMLYDRLAPFSPIMAQTEPAEARRYVSTGITNLLKCQQEDGGLAYWYGARSSSPWASAYAGLVLTLALENGFTVPEQAMEALKSYLRAQLELSRRPQPTVTFSPFDLYAIGRTIGDADLANEALATALRSAEQESEEAAIFGSRRWWGSGYAVASLRFLGQMSAEPENLHEPFLAWMRAVGHDYRHATTWDGGWMLIALHEYLRRTPDSSADASITLEDGRQLTLGNGLTTLTPAPTATLGETATVLSTTAGTAYITVRARALPEKTEYPGVTENGLQVTRIYEKRGEDGVWREATEFNVGDVVRVTLTCAKTDRDLEYFILEDYLPACMEAINPEIPSQAAGLEPRAWSHWFDQKEYLADRVRGFCTRWGGRDLLNMSYYARVKRSGVSTAPPAQGQLMYEPQTYGLSPNTVITSH